MDLDNKSTKELVALHNERCPPDQQITSNWKSSKQALIERINALGATQTELHETTAAEVTDDAAIEVLGNVAAPKTRSNISALTERLLMTPAGYAEIVAAVKAQFPDARTTVRSVASVASVLRKAGVSVPARRVAKVSA